jgi:hypothetical protein
MKSFKSIAIAGMIAASPLSLVRANQQTFELKKAAKEAETALESKSRTTLMRCWKEKLHNIFGDEREITKIQDLAEYLRNQFLCERKKERADSLAEFIYIVCGRQSFSPINPSRTFNITKRMLALVQCNNLEHCPLKTLAPATEWLKSITKVISGYESNEEDDTKDRYEKRFAELFSKKYPNGIQFCGATKKCEEVIKDLEEIKAKVNAEFETQSLKRKRK